jgi:serine/threonine protein kinase
MRDDERFKSREFGPYEILDFLGQGGIGEAYVARTKQGEHANQRVCLKIMGREFQASTGSRRREAIDSLRHEARVVSQLEHPNIARLLDSGAVNDVWFLVFELIEGASLGEVLSLQEPEQGLAPQHVRRIGLEVAAALQCAHEHDVLHRDIKPNNILVGTDGAVKLVDFGLAKANARGASDFTVGVGTPRYWAPEQIREEALTPATDIYALGVVLYELLTTAHPFQDDDASEFRKNILRGIPQHDLRALGVPDDLAEIVHGCLKADSWQRFQSAAALQTALRSGAKASGFEFDMGEIASAARELSAETRAMAADSNLRAESGHGAETVHADVHRRTTRYETPQELADEMREGIPGTISSHVRDEVMDDLSRMARQARDRRHSHTARRRDGPSAEGAPLNEQPTVHGRRRDATVLEGPEHLSRSEPAEETLPTPARRRSRRTVQGFSQLRTSADAAAATASRSTPPEASATIEAGEQRAPTEELGVKHRGRRLAIVLGLVATAIAAGILVQTTNGSSTASRRSAAAASRSTTPGRRPPEAVATTIAARTEAPTPLPVPVENPPVPPAAATAPAVPTIAPTEPPIATVPRPSTRASRETRPSVKVTIGLIPYGEVFIDGKAAGRAPVTMSLTTGPHRVVGRNSEFRNQRTVVVTPETHGVVLDLRDGKTLR